MREGWTYKKLGEVAVKISDGSHNPPKGVDYSPYPMLSSKNVFFDYFNYDDPRYLSKEAFEEENKRTDISEGDVLLTIVGTVGRTCCVKSPFIPFTLQRSVAVLKPKKECVVSRFLMFALHSLSELWNNEAKGVAQKGVYLRQLASIPIPVPPLSEQERIVSELDLLTSIINKQKAQLKELDSLAQSIFYDMFGDPIENPKGWEVKKLGEVCSKITDGTHNSPINTEKGDYMYITAKNIKRDGVILDNITYVSADVHKSIYERCNPQYGDILYIKDGITTGIAAINTLKEEFSLLSSVALLKPKECLINHYLKSVLNMPSQYASIRENMGGAAITRLTIAKINVIKIPLPPLSLQQSFASKIEAIEAQKALITKSMEETQRLFDSRMDYWFA